MTAQEEAELRQAAKSTPPSALEAQRPVTNTVYHADGRMTGRLSMSDMESLKLVQTTDGKTVLTHDEAAPTVTPAAAAELPTE